MSARLPLLIIATNAAPTLHGKRSGLYLSEMTHFLEVIGNAGYDYVIASPKGGPIPLDETSVTPKQLADPTNARFMNQPAFKQALEGSLACADVDPTDYSALYLTGGHGTMWDFRDSDDLQRVITAMHSAGRLLSGVCHGVAGFVDSVDAQGELIVRGRKVTGFSNREDGLAKTKKLMPFLLEDALKANGAHYKKNLIPFTRRVEVDGPLVTGQNPQSAKGVAEAVVERLEAHRDTGDQLRDPGEPKMSA